MTQPPSDAQRVAETAICERCGIDLWSGADCALEGFPCLGDEGELDAHNAEKQANAGRHARSTPEREG